MIIPNLPVEEQDKIILLIKKMLPADTETLLLCLTGSRAYGWGGTKYDIDVRGLYVTRGLFWDNCHYGKQSYDITMEELQHFLRDMKWRWVLYEDMSMPFYIHPAFDWVGFQTLCSSDHVRSQRYTINMELENLFRYRQVRKALHCYRQLMVSIHFLETYKILIDVEKLNEKFGSPWFPILSKMYLTGEGGKVEWDSILSEIKVLETRLDKTLETSHTKFDEAKFTKWKEKLEAAVYG